MIVIKPSATPANDNFARASTATYLGTDGVLKTAGVNAPRYVNGVMVIEGAATNLLLRSEQLDDVTSWTRAAGPTYTVTANTDAAPDGFTTADSLSMTASATAGVYQTVTVTASTTYTFSWWAKRGADTAVAYRVYNVSGASDITAATSYYSSINASTWTRVSVTFTTPVGCTSVRVYPLAGNASLSSGAKLWGAQLETGSTATAYIPTTTTTASRSADSFTSGYITCHDINGTSVGTSPIVIVETDDAPAWVSGATYAINDLVVRTQTHRIYRRLTAGAGTTAPESDTTNWVEVSATQKYRPFDGLVSNQAMLTGFYSLALSLFLGGASAISLIGMRGISATVKVTDGAGGAVIYSASKTLADDRYSYPAWPGSGNSWQLVDWHLTGIPTGYPNAVAHVVILAGPTLTEYATLRELYYGGGFDIGETQGTPRIGITDYSRKVTDDFGQVTFVRRDFSRRLTCEVRVALADFQKVYSLLADLRATICQWVPEASGSYTPLMMQGWYRDFSIAVAYPTYLLCTLEVESLATDSLVEV